MEADSKVKGEEKRYGGGAGGKDISHESMAVLRKLFWRNLYRIHSQHDLLGL